MQRVRSPDGTLSAFDRVGQGPPIVLVDGALCYRASGPMKVLEREFEDLDALVAEAGGSAFVVGLSSGAALALEAAARGLAVRKLALYEV